MSYPDKRLNICAALGKLQATFGTGVTPSASTDGFELQYSDRHQASLVDDDWEFDGSLGPAVSTLYPTKRVPPSGHGGSASLPHRWKGHGGAYSVSNRPHNADIALQIAGFDATTDASVGVEKVTYTPTPDSTTPKSATFEFWCAQVDGASTLEKRVLDHCIADIEMSFSDKSPPIWTLKPKGAYTDPTESAFTLPTYPHSSVIPPLASNFSFSWNSISTLQVYEGKFMFNREIDQANLPQNSNGAHQGFVAGGFKPIFEVLVRAPKFATLNPYSSVAAATSGVLAYSCGSVQYNKYTLNGTVATIISAKPEARGPIQCVRMQFEISSGLSIVFD